MRRTRFELKKAEDRAHILEGLKIALDHIDAIISLIRSSKDTSIAMNGLMENFGLSEIQAESNSGYAVQTSDRFGTAEN